MLTSVLTALTTLFVAGVFTFFLALAAVFTVLRFRSELQRIRISDGLDDSVPADIASTDRSGVADLQEAASLLISAEGGFKSGLRRARWELVGLGNPDVRESEIAKACGELLQAQRAIRQANMKLSNFEIDAGQDVPVFHDPVRALAARGQWIGWAFLSVMPGFVRGIYGFPRIRRELLRLSEVSEELFAKVDSYRASVTPAPVRVALRDRMAAAA